MSVHPYRQTDPETVAPEYRKLRVLIAKYAPAGKQIPIISGEWGYSSSWKNFDEERQGECLARQWLTNVANEIPVSIWYDWHEDGVNPKEAEDHFGSVHHEYNKDSSPAYLPKPAYLAAQRLTQELDGYAFSKRLWTGKADTYELLFTKGDDQKLVIWTVNAKPTAAPTTQPGLTFDDDSFTAKSYREGFEPAAQTKGLAPLDSPTPVYCTPAKPSDLLRIAAEWSRAPLGISVTAPTTATVITTVRNPLDHPITLLTPGGKIKLDPGASHTLSAAQYIMRNDFSEVISDLEIEGLGKLSQRTDVVVSNPLVAIVLPREGSKRSIIVQNPTGEPFTATALLTGASYSPVSEVELKAGEKQKTITFMLPGNLPPDDRAGLTLLGAEDKPIFDVQPVRVVALPTFAAEGDASAWRATVDGDPKVESHLSTSIADPPGGPPGAGLKCLKVDYSFAKGWKFLQVRAAAPGGLPLERKPRIISLWVYGDGKRNLIRMRFVDAKGQTFQPDADRMTFTGWKHLSFPLDGRSAYHYGGPDDGVVHYPIRIDTAFLLDSFNQKATAGEFYLSTPMLVYE